MQPKKFSSERFFWLVVIGLLLLQAAFLVGTYQLAGPNKTGWAGVTGILVAPFLLFLNGSIFLAVLGRYLPRSSPRTKVLLGAVALGLVLALVIEARRKHERRQPLLSPAAGFFRAEKLSLPPGFHKLSEEFFLERALLRYGDRGRADRYFKLEQKRLGRGEKCAFEDATGKPPPALTFTYLGSEGRVYEDGPLANAPSRSRVEFEYQGVCVLVDFGYALMERPTAETMAAIVRSLQPVK